MKIGYYKECWRCFRSPQNWPQIAPQFESEKKKIIRYDEYRVLKECRLKTATGKYCHSEN